jgi:hypothetical protein
MSTGEPSSFCRMSIRIFSSPMNDERVNKPSNVATSGSLSKSINPEAGCSKPFLYCEKICLARGY